jgi:hypothetical protein
MKKLIVRQQVIDCNKETCGKCRFLIGTFGPAGRYEERNTCSFWNKVLSNNGQLVCRCHDCKNAEVSK